MSFGHLFDRQLDNSADGMLLVCNQSMSYDYVRANPNPRPLRRTLKDKHGSLKSTLELHFRIAPN